MSESEPGAATAAASARATYVFETRVSRFTVRAFAGGLLSAFAHNPTFAVRRFTAEAGFDPSALALSSLKIVVDATSLELTDKVSDSDRREIDRIMREQVLEVDKFPTIEFHSTSVEAGDQGGGRYHGSVTGPFTLHGVTRDITIAADATTMGTQLRVYGEFPLLQTDFGITLVSVAAAAIKVKDELKCGFDLVARRQE